MGVLKSVEPTGFLAFAPAFAGTNGCESADHPKLPARPRMCLVFTRLFGSGFAGLGNAWRVFDDGVIDIDTAEKFEEYLQRNDVTRRSIVFLNSPGGNLMGGIKLGKVIRKWGLFTYIARKIRRPRKGHPGRML
jgi:hypothetical protein